MFDSKTSNGEDMEHYSGLVSSALRFIERTFGKRAAASLLSGRDGLLPKASETPKTDTDGWELVTWLVILDPEK